MSVIEAECEQTTLDRFAPDHRLNVAALAERRLNDGSVLALRNVACDFQDGVLTS